MAVRGINYDDGNPNDYESVYIHYVERKEKVFASGNFVKDWYDALKWYLHADLNEYTLCNSSSVDHFIMDEAPFESSYLCYDEATRTWSLDKDGYERGIEFFVKKGENPTWEELKEYCGIKKENE